MQSTDLFPDHARQLSAYERTELEKVMFEKLTHQEHSTVKIIFVKPGEALSLQRHQKRDEFWRIVSGAGYVTVGTERVEIYKPEGFFIPRTTLHRLEGHKDDGLLLVEIAFGEFDENDIERLEDKYNR